MIHDFQESLRKSQNPAYEQFWQACYRNEFGELLVGAFYTGDAQSHWQKTGVDRIVLLKNGAFFFVDEKCRECDYGDILLEFASVAYRSGNGWRVDKPGWSIDPTKICDFVIYGIPTTGKYWFMPYHSLRTTVGANLADWQARYRVIEAENRGYVSLSVAVPWDVLAQAMVGTIKRELKITKLPPIKKLLKTPSKGLSPPSLYLGDSQKMPPASSPGGKVQKNQSTLEVTYNDYSTKRNV